MVFLLNFFLVNNLRTMLTSSSSFVESESDSLSDSIFVFDFVSLLEPAYKATPFSTWLMLDCSCNSNSQNNSSNLSIERSLKTLYASTIDAHKAFLGKAFKAYLIVSRFSRLCPIRWRPLRMSFSQAWSCEAVSPGNILILNKLFKSKSRLFTLDSSVPSCSLIRESHSSLALS